MSLSLALLILGRVLMGGYFLWAGLHHFTILDPVSKAMAARGVPQARLVLIAASSFQIVCGAALMLGLYVALVAIGLILFTIAASIMLVNFWDMEGAAREGALGTFKSNAALVGGLMVTATTGL